jgi:hypothetical protein
MAIIGPGGFMDDQKSSRVRPPLKLKKESLRLLRPDDLDQVVGGKGLGRGCSRYCLTGY